MDKIKFSITKYLDDNESILSVEIINTSDVFMIQSKNNVFNISFNDQSDRRYLSVNDGKDVRFYIEEYNGHLTESTFASLCKNIIDDNVYEVHIDVYVVNEDQKWPASCYYKTKKKGGR